MIDYSEVVYAWDIPFATTNDIQQTNCPNCGAPIQSDKCEYCGTVFRRKENDG